MNDKYKGMTVNERLYVSGYLQEYDNAVKEKNASKIEFILRGIELTETSIDLILESLGLKPN